MAEAPPSETGTAAPPGAFELLLSVFNSIATVWIVVLMVVINIDIFGRTAFAAPLPGVPELVKLSIVAIIFLQIGHTLRVLRGDKELAGVKTLLPGDSATASGTFEKGRYDLVCILGNHRVLGMYGTLTVR